MPRKKKTDTAQVELLQVKVNTAPCVPAIRAKVKDWVDGGYKGTTETTRILLNHWFHTDHRLPSGRSFRYHAFQREAVETMVYLYEVAQVRRFKTLAEGFGLPANARLLQYDEFTRYCIKMATGSGKTKVMSLAVAWHYFNSQTQPGNDYASSFLILAPNVIVFERLRTDFEGGRIFHTDPIIPNELRIYWDFQCYMRGESERASSQGSLYLTNIQQFYERAGAKPTEPDVMTAMMGPKPPAQNMETVDFDERIIKRDHPVLVLNDEAHHTHDEESEWNKTIRSLHAQTPKGVVSQLDFSATPRHNKGQLFSWTIYDYPLKQAILDNVVKRPLKGIATGIKEQRSEVASTRYQAYVTAGVERWKEYRDQLTKVGKKPIFFVMLNSTEEADDVGDWLRVKYPEEFGADKLLIIHTDKSGEVSKKDLDHARKLAREVDSGESPVNAIVSVLMLREGWDVQNVTVIVGLRPYSSKANILPEQTIGRGLRLMFRGTSGGYEERVDVIGNKNFIEFVEQLEKEEGLQLDTFEVGKEKVVIVTISPDPAKSSKDIAMPVLSPILSRKGSLSSEIAGLNVQTFKSPILPKKREDIDSLNFKYEGFDLLSQKKIIEREYSIPEPQTPEEVIGYYARRIAQDVKLPSQFAALVPKVREFLEKKAFGEPVNLSEPGMVKAISSNVAQYVTIKVFVDALRKLVVLELEPELVDSGRNLSITPPFPWSRPTLIASKCIYNLVPCDNEFEKQFAGFLEKASDVDRFAKLPEQFGFIIEYTDNSGNLRYYEPDFVAVAQDGTSYLIETKGMEDTNVAHKDRAATIWCENATTLTQQPWKYLKVRQTDYNQLQPDELADLEVLRNPDSLPEQS